MPTKDKKRLSILERFGPQNKAKQAPRVGSSAETQTKEAWIVFPSRADRESIPASWIPAPNTEEADVPRFNRKTTKGDNQ